MGHSLEIKVSYDYDMFKLLDGNRSITNIRMNKVRKSVQEIGQMRIPILVNERLEIVDGQARFNVFKELGLPIYYVTQSGIGIKECAVINTTSTAWKMSDYVDSYVAMGNINYIRLKMLIDRYPHIKLTNIACATLGMFSLPTDKIKAGLVKISDERFHNACDALDFVESLLEYIKRIETDRTMLVNAIIFAYGVPEVDNKRLAQCIRTKYMSIGGFTNIDGALRSLSLVYNHRLKSGQVYLDVEYKKAMSDMYSWYAKKWGDNE